MKIEVNTQHPITFIDGLTLLFIGLKLSGIIDWSWVWVLFPEWICIVITIVCTLLLKRNKKI